MPTPHDQSAPTSFDPFGEPVSPSVARASMGTVGDRLARRVGGTVFWSLALLILAGRVYAHNRFGIIDGASHISAQIAQVFAMR